MIETSSEFTISRIINTPRELVWKAWTDKEQLAAWFGPVGCPMIDSTLELTEGGVYHYGLQVPDGSQMWAKWTFQEIVELSRLVWEFSFSDVKGEAIIRHPFSATWPLQMILLLTLEPLDNATRLTLSIKAINVNEIERRTFDEGKVGMTQGWGNTLDQLATFLASNE